jgi:adenylyltransferase/sulfurtransferase
MRFRELKLRKDPDCPVCGTHPTVTKLIDYEQFCGIRPEAATVEASEQGVNQFRNDVVEIEEAPRRRRRRVHSRRARAQRVSDLPYSWFGPIPWVSCRDVTLSCRRTKDIVRELQDGRPQRKGDGVSAIGGFKRVKNLKGGILDWIDKVDPSQPKY